MGILDIDLNIILMCYEERILVLQQQIGKCMGSVGHQDIIVDIQICLSTVQEWQWQTIIVQQARSLIM